MFAYPELFHLNYKYNEIYDFTLLCDKAGNRYKLITNDKRSLVIPERPFSIIDKIGKLSNEGFNKFIIDFSNIELKKNFYKNVIKKAINSEVLQDSSRFNWKNGFCRTNLDS